MNFNRWWTDDKISIVLQMRDDGFSTSQIAKRLGTTKNAVCGVVNRRGFSKPPEKILFKKIFVFSKPQESQLRELVAQNKGNAYIAKIMNMTEKQIASGVRQFKLIGKRTANPTLAIKPMPKIEREIAPPGGMSLLYASNRHCRYHLGTGADNLPRCCGAETVYKSWCEHHKRVVFSKAAA